MAWTVICEPKGKNPGAIKRAASAVTGSDPEQGNVSGMIVYLAQGATREEFSRVAFVRRNSKNPKTPFDKQLAAEVKRANEAAKILNDVGAGGGELL